ncbi:MAG: hypothetical protein GTO14_18030 [Anaerolineales bacterium]|nr:hypothetical protein [Anaerolineales bacterium]
METILTEIDDVIGVRGSFVVGADGEVAATTMSAVYESRELNSAGRALQRTIEGLQIESDQTVIEMNLQYSGGRLVVKSVDKGCLVILCEPDINVSLLNLTANVAVRKISEQLLT